VKLRGIDLVGNWRPAELAELTRFLAPLPAAWLEQNPQLRILAREPVLRGAPPSAPGHSKYEPSVGAIVVYDKGVYDGERIDPKQFRRSVFHELAHTLVRQTPRLLAAWTASTMGAGFVDDYARSHPEEDFADTFSEFLIDPRATHDAVPPKAEFIRCMLDESGKPQEKVAMNFMRGFKDELIKTAKPGAGRLASLMRFGRKAAPHAGGGSSRMGLAKGLALGGGAAIGAGVLGERKGEKKGYNEGTSDVMQVAQQARQIGRREGVMAYHQALQEKLRGGGGES
jgi:hypothetical protein